MTSADFIKSLSPEQAAAMNALLVEQRDAINTMRDVAMAEIVASHAADAANKEAEILAEKAKAAHLEQVAVALDAGDVDAAKAAIAEAKRPEEDKEREAAQARIDELLGEILAIKGKYDIP